VKNCLRSGPSLKSRESWKTIFNLYRAKLGEHRRRVQRGGGIVARNNQNLLKARKASESIFPLRADKKGNEAPEEGREGS